jgi:CRISPR-associated protein Csb2
LELARRRFFSYVTTRREGKPQPPARLAFGLRLQFDVEVSGPVAIGYGSHFGLGLFAAE